eukprot:scaffold23667_cov51-Skeletonema_menzelii.AAC.1
MAVSKSSSKASYMYGIARTSSSTAIFSCTNTFHQPKKSSASIFHPFHPFHIKIALAVEATHVCCRCPPELSIIARKGIINLWTNFHIKIALAVEATH